MSNVDISRLIETIQGTLFDLNLLSETLLEPLILEWESILIRQRLLLDLKDVPTLVVGDIHGDFENLMKAFYVFDSYAVDQVIFLGDIVDRGPKMLESLITIMIRQVAEPDKVFYIRGNHEIRSINEFYGFQDECNKYFSTRVYDLFTRAFEQLPHAALIGNHTFLVHGGIPIKSLNFNIMRLEVKPQDALQGIYADLLWNDPSDEISGYQVSVRGEQFNYFGQKIFDHFMNVHNLKLVIRAHEAYEEGYRWFFDNRLLSIYSSKMEDYIEIDPHMALVHQSKAELIRNRDIAIEHWDL